VLSVELNPAGVERKAAVSSCDATDEVDDGEEVESEHAEIARTTAMAAAKRSEELFIMCFSDQRCRRWPG
jgi:hypothetical protein